MSEEKKIGGGMEIRNDRGLHIESALRKLKRKLKKEGVFEEMRRKEYYIKPSERRRIAKIRAIKRWQKELQKKAMLD